MESVAYLTTAHSPGLAARAADCRMAESAKQRRAAATGFARQGLRKGGFLAPLLVAGAGFLALPATAQAQGAAPDTEQGRYSLHKTDSGFLRLDSRTGQVSLCSLKGAGWACETVPDERIALENEIARLQDANAALKKELLAQGLALPKTAQPKTAQPDANEKSGELRLRLPDQADVDRVMTFIEKVWRRLLDMVDNLQKETLRKT